MIRRPPGSTRTDPLSLLDALPSCWSRGSWRYLREGSGNASGTIGGASQLGGSQAGLRLAYVFGETGRVRAYGRATMALGRPRQRELAFGQIGSATGRGRVCPSG